jgi:DNA-binding XRE family transcriptional regulator
MRLTPKRYPPTRLSFRYHRADDGETMVQRTNPFYEKFGKRLRKARNQAGLTQEVASGLVGMDQTNLSRLELGKQALTLKDAYRLAELYRVPYDHLVMLSSPLDDRP